MLGETDRVRRWLGSHLKLVLLTGIVALGVPAALAFATVPDSNGVIHTCYEVSAASGLPKAPGPNWRVIDPSAQSCDPGTEKPLSVNQQGPAGPPGPLRAGGRFGRCRRSRISARRRSGP